MQECCSKWQPSVLQALAFLVMAGAQEHMAPCCHTCIEAREMPTACVVDEACGCTVIFALITVRYTRTYAPRAAAGPPAERYYWDITPRSRACVAQPEKEVTSQKASRAGG